MSYHTDPIIKCMWSDGSVTFTTVDVIARFIALYGKPTRFTYSIVEA